MKRFAALSLSALTALAFTTATLAPTLAEAKSHVKSHSKKHSKKKKSSKSHAAKKSHKSAPVAAVSTPKEDRTPAGTAERSTPGYQRAALYMAKHDDGVDTASKKKKSRKKS